MHTHEDLLNLFTLLSRVSKVLNRSNLPCPGLPGPFEPFLLRQPEGSELDEVDPRLVPFAIVCLRNAVQQALGEALSCERLNVVIRIDSIENVIPAT